MKKVVAFLMLGLILAFATSLSTQAADGDLVDLYPYGQIACLEGTNACTQLKLGDSFWDLEYAGHRYHFVRGAARFANQFNDANVDGFFSAGELGGALSWNAFAALYINNTASEVVLTSANARTDLSTVVHRMYSYFDETGKLQMYENHINTFYIFNDGTVAAPDWRLATAAEAAAWDAAATESKPVTTRNTHIRMKLDATDSNGYKLEPIGYLKWTNADVDVATAPVEDWSTIITGNPDNVTIPVGWTVVSWGTNDRGAANALTTQYVKDMPTFMLDNTLAPAKTVYTTQKPLFNNALGALDDDPTSPGINVIVDYNDDFVLPTGIEASYVDMFDATDALINQTKKINYDVIISQDDAVLETITYTYDSVAGTYTASAPITVIDSSVFGGAYVATYKAVDPENAALVNETHVDIVIGVMPPKFIGVAPRYSDEGVAIDLLEGITADDGYGDDITDTIMVTAPVGFNPYNPQVGTYTIELEFTHHVVIEGIAPVATITVNGADITWDMLKNLSNGINTYGDYMVFTDDAVFHAAGTAYGSVMVYVNPEGKVKQWYDRYNWNHLNALGVVEVGDEAKFNAWKNGFVIEEGGFILAAHGSVKAPAIRNLPLDAAVVATIGTDDMNFEIPKETSYVLTIDDINAPIALVVNPIYQVTVGEFTSVNAAILNNVVAFDNASAIGDLAMFVSDDDDLDLAVPGTYEVEVTVEDEAGNATVVSFDLVLIANAEADAIEDLEALIDALEADLAALEADLAASDTASAALADRIATLEAALEAAQDAIDDLEAFNEIVPDTGCGSAINTSSTLFITFSILLGAALVVFLKRRR
ncbi:MAG: hypothetical protein RBQ71_05885 [Acholeplasmataceae bacterium]|jgi:hypothetical protein|nr:hypothetical protein [Acholeplasmataceae bacterium]